ncbi:MAG TPA: DUF4340 domain-containing protein [Polyangia bacterium]|nr:DUF4340 domain-containing protein [Polyangia bacterium]
MRALGILGAIAALLAAYLLFFDRDARDSRAAADAARLVPAFDPAAVRRVGVARPGEAPFALVPAEGGWVIEPGRAPADRAAVEDLLRAVDQAESTRGSDLNAQAAGLAPPRVALTIEATPRSVELRLGNPDSSGRGVFVQAGAGAAVRVGPRRLLELADRSAAAFRDRRLFQLSPDSVAGVAWRNDAAGPEHRWQRVAPDRWRNAAGARLGADRVAALLRRLTELRGAEPGAASGPPLVEAGWVELRDEAGHVARVTGAELPAAERDDLWRALQAADAPDLRLLSVPPPRVRQLVLEDGQRRLRLLRDGAAQPWRFDGAAARLDVDQDAVAEWLARLASSSATGRGSQGRRLIVDGDAEGAVTVGRADPAFPLLDPDPLRFRSRKVLDFAHFDVRELQRTGRGGGFDLRSADGETWSRVPGGEPVDGATAARIVGRLGNLRAERFLESAPSEPATVVLRVEIQPPGSHATPEWHRLDLWDGCVARTDDGAVFRLSADACSELRLDPTPKR